MNQLELQPHSSYYRKDWLKSLWLINPLHDWSLKISPWRFCSVWRQFLYVLCYCWTHGGGLMYQTNLSQSSLCRQSFTSSIDKSTVLSQASNVEACATFMGGQYLSFKRYKVITMGNNFTLVWLISTTGKVKSKPPCKTQVTCLFYIPIIIFSFHFKLHYEMKTNTKI